MGETLRSGSSGARSILSPPRNGDSFRVTSVLRSNLICFLVTIFSLAIVLFAPDLTGGADEDEDASGVGVWVAAAGGVGEDDDAAAVVVVAVGSDVGGVVLVAAVGGMGGVDDAAVTVAVEGVGGVGGEVVGLAVEVGAGWTADSVGVSLSSVTVDVVVVGGSVVAGAVNTKVYSGVATVGGVVVCGGGADVVVVDAVVGGMNGWGVGVAELD